MKMNLTGAIEILKLHKHTTDKFKHSVGDQYVSDAIDTVVSLINTPNKTGLDENLLEKGIEQPDNQDVLSYKKDRLYTAEDMEAFAEWCADSLYEYIGGNRWKSYDLNRIATTTKLRELWEKERRAK